MVSPEQPQAQSRRELREREAALKAAQAATSVAPAAPVEAAATPAAALAPTAQVSAPATPAAADASHRRVVSPAVVPATAPQPAPQQAPAAADLPTFTAAITTHTVGERTAARRSAPTAAERKAAASRAKATAASATSARRNARSEADIAAALAASANKSSSISRRQRATKRVASFGILLVAGATLVGLTVPVSMFSTDEAASAPAVVTTADTSGQQTIIADGAIPKMARDSIGVSSEADLQQLVVGRSTNTYSVATGGDIRWPFPNAVPITDGFGPRVSPCSGCSTEHKGTDFTPGLGTPIYAIADGVVSLHDVDAWGLGNHVQIEHKIKGQKISSVYAHMELGSSKLVVGQKIKVGDFIGLVGQTGAATGPHLHFEIHVEGVPVDATIWLAANAG